MSQGALAIVTTACNELGYDAPTMLFGASDDPDASQLLALVQSVGEDLLASYDWSFLTVEGATISLVSGQELYPLPADFDRLVGGTSWDRSNRWRTQGPDDPQTARWRRESITSLGPRRATRQVGSNLSVWPVPATTGDLIAFDYVSNAWAVNAAGALQSAFMADTDTTLFRPRLMIEGVKWMWLAAKGMETTALQLQYQSEKKKAIARDMGGGQVLNMSRRRGRGRGNADDVVAAGPVTILGTTNGPGIGVD